MHVSKTKISVCTQATTPTSYIRTSPGSPACSFHKSSQRNLILLAHVLSSLCQMFGINTILIFFSCFYTLLDIISAFKCIIKESKGNHYN